MKESFFVCLFVCFVLLFFFFACLPAYFTFPPMVSRNKQKNRAVYSYFLFLCFFLFSLSALFVCVRDHIIIFLNTCLFSFVIVICSSFFVFVCFCAFVLFRFRCKFFSSRLLTLFSKNQFALRFHYTQNGSSVCFSLPLSLLVLLYIPCGHYLFFSPPITIKRESMTWNSWVLRLYFISKKKSLSLGLREKRKRNKNRQKRVVCIK